MLKQSRAPVTVHNVTVQLREVFHASLGR